mgnify:CR=1 FL=1
MSKYKHANAAIEQAVAAAGDLSWIVARARSLALAVRGQVDEALGFTTGMGLKVVSLVPTPAACFEAARESGLIDLVCRACSAKLGVTEEVEALGLPLGGEMNGHPAMSAYIDEGYTIITF